MMKVAAVGFCCIDVYENMNNRCYATGNGVDVVINLSKHGISSSVISAVGNDDYGRLMLDTLHGYGIDTTHLHVQDGGKTAVIKMSLNGRDRVHGERIRGVMEGYALAAGDLEFIREHDIVHTDLSWRVVEKLPQIHQGKTKVFFDFSIKHAHPDLEKILPHINWGMFSFDEDSEQVREFLKRGCSLGPEILIATFGRKGAIAYDGREFHFQGIVEDSGVVNTVGAGDAFASGFLLGKTRGLDLQNCLYLGAQTSAEIVGKFEPY